ncbi:MAG: hypothetical protein V2I66_00715 [Halieaceae bacterium]|nr:hypothetical protein [Halieaceae bacterium]
MRFEHVRAEIQLEYAAVTSRQQQEIAADLQKTVDSVTCEQRVLARSVVFESPNTGMEKAKPTAVIANPKFVFTAVVEGQHFVVEK